MESGIAHLGGHGTFLDVSTMQISHGETAKDTATILSSYGHGIACRYCNWGYRKQIHPRNGSKFNSICDESTM